MSTQSSHNQDITNLMYPTAHRMPTVSAAEALQNLNDPQKQRISTSLPGLDNGLHILPPGTPRQPFAGGVLRGQVTEIYGPPGIGKTAFGIQLASNALHSGDGVVWVDCAQPLPGPRLSTVLESIQTVGDPSQPSVSLQPPTTGDLLQKFHHFTTPTMPHLVALLCHARPSFPPQSTSLIVIDMMSLLIDYAFPRTSTNVSVAGNVGIRPKTDLQAWSASRRWSVLQCIMSSLQKLATFHNIAIVLLNHSVTYMAPGARAFLAPALSSAAWLAGIGTHVLLFRGSKLGLDEERFAFPLRVDGIQNSVNAAIHSRSGVVSFKIGNDGLHEVRLVASTPISAADILKIASRKRKADEIRDSDEDDTEPSDDEYGWAAGDDGALPQPPPQWQGSEDILVPGAGETADEEEHEHEHKDSGEEAEAYGDEETVVTPIPEEADSGETAAPLA